MTLLSEVSCSSTPEDVAPATASLAAETACPALAVIRLAVSCGYGVQAQFVPWGTESPSATIDCGVGAAEVAVVAVPSEQPDTRHPSDITTAVARRTRLSSM